MSESTESTKSRRTTESVPKRVLMVVSNPTVSDRTGWPVGFWWAELTHSYWEFVGAGYQVDIVSPDGGEVKGDTWSDPRDESGYSADDLLSRGFIGSPRHAPLLEETPSLEDVDVGAYDAVFLVGGQAPMYTFAHDPRVHALVRTFFESGRPTAVVCHATSALLEATGSDGKLLVTGRTWTGFANSEEDAADAFVGQTIQPFRIEDRARALPDTNFVVHGAFQPHAVRDGNLITGQQQHSGPPAARAVIEALGR
jgi:putative intracellular protease/amidase